MIDTIAQPSWIRLLGIVILTVLLIGGLMTSGLGLIIVLLSGEDMSPGVLSGWPYWGSLSLCLVVMGLCLAGLFSIVKYCFATL